MINKIVALLFLINHLSYAMEKTHPLVKAIVSNASVDHFTKLLEQLKQEDNDINTIIHGEYGLLEMAIVFNRLPIAQELVYQGADTNILDKKLPSFINIINNKKDFALFNFILDYIKNSSIIKYESDFVKMAIDFNSKPLFGYLIDRGVNKDMRIVYPDCMPKKGLTILQYVMFKQPGMLEDVTKIMSKQINEIREQTAAMNHRRIEYNINKKIAKLQEERKPLSFAKSQNNNIIPEVNILSVIEVKHKFMTIVTEINNHLNYFSKNAPISINEITIKDVDDDNIIIYFDKDIYSKKIANNIYDKLRSDPYKFSVVYEDNYLDIVIIAKKAIDMTRCRDEIVGYTKLYLDKKLKNIKDSLKPNVVPEFPSYDDHKPEIRPHSKVLKSNNNYPNHIKNKRKDIINNNNNNKNKAKVNKPKPPIVNKRVIDKPLAVKPNNKLPNNKLPNNTLPEEDSVKPNNKLSTYKLSNDAYAINTLDYPSPFLEQNTKKKDKNIIIADDNNIVDIEDKRLAILINYINALNKLSQKPMNNMIEILTHGVIAIDWLNGKEHLLDMINDGLALVNKCILKDDIISLEQTWLFNKLKNSYKNYQEISLDNRINHINNLLDLVKIYDIDYWHTQANAMEAILFILGEHYARLIEAHVNMMDVRPYNNPLIWEIKGIRNAFKHGDDNIISQGEGDDTITFMLGKHDKDKAMETFLALWNELKKY